MEYSNAHKAFLQILLQHRILSAREVKITYEKVCNHFNFESTSLRDFILLINGKLEELHMVIRKSVQEEDDKDVQCFVLINNLNNEFTRACSSFTKVELAFLKKLVGDFVDTDDGYISEMTVLNMASNKQCKMSASAAEKLIDRLVEGKWLLRNNGQISLGALTVCELQTYLEEHFKESCAKCFFCKIFTFKGYTCPECRLWGHRTCLKNYWTNIDKNPSCPDESCGAQWDYVTEFISNKRSRTAHHD